MQKTCRFLYTHHGLVKKQVASGTERVTFDVEMSRKHILISKFGFAAVGFFVLPLVISNKCCQGGPLRGISPQSVVARQHCQHESMVYEINDGPFEPQINLDS